MRGKRRHRLWLWVAGTVALATTGAAVLFSRPKPLLQAASDFCIVGPWAKQTLYPSRSNYYWLSDTSALIVPDADRSGSGSMYEVTLMPDGRAGAPASLSSAPAAPAGYLNISPDGRYLAYLDMPFRPQPQKPKQYLVVHSIADGHENRCLWPTANPDTGLLDAPISRFAWSPDSKSICQLQSRPKPSIRRFFVADQRVEEITLSKDRLAPGDPDTSVLVGYTGRDRVLIAPNGGYFEDARVNGANGGSNHNFPRLPLIEVSMAPPYRVIRNYSLRAPMSVCLGTVVLSPKGDRLLWAALCVNKAPPLQVRLHRHLPFVPGEDTLVERGWISAVDGSDMREIGSYSVPAAKVTGTNSNEPWILDPKWTPDGKRIGFVYKDKLMTIPVD